MSANSPAPTSTQPEWTDFYHTGPGTLAGRYLRMFWHPIYRSSELTVGTGKPVRVMGEDFTLYRGESGTPHLLAFRCAHRMTQLSTGWVEDDNIRCFFHGWVYDGSGQCIEQPAESHPFCERIRIPSYPTREYLGVIFAYLGEGQPPEFPTFPQLEDEGVIEVQKYIRDCNYFQNLENDPIHGAFVHRRGRGPRRIPRVRVEETEWGMTQFAELDGTVKRSETLMPLWDIGKVTPVDEESGWRDTLTMVVPIDDEHFMSFRIHLVHVTGEKAEQFLSRRQAWFDQGGQEHAVDVAYKVLAGDLYVEDLYKLPNARKIHWATVEDDISQIGQGLITDRTREHLAETDIGIIVLRKLWARELRALAEGRPLTQWRRPERFEVTEGQSVAYGEVITA